MTQKRGKEFEGAVKDLLNAYNLYWRRVDTYRCPRCKKIINRNAAGIPDYIVLDPFMLWIECKTGSSQLNENQRKVKKHLDERGQDYIVVRDNIDKLHAVIQEELGK